MRPICAGYPAFASTNTSATTETTLLYVGNCRPELETLIGPSAAGFAFDFSRSYVLPITAGILANVAAAAIATVTSTARS